MLIPFCKQLYARKLAAYTVTHSVQNIPFIDFKGTLQNHLACLGIIPPKPVSYPQLGDWFITNKIG